LNGESSLSLSERLKPVDIAIKESDSLNRVREELLSGGYPVLVTRCDSVRDQVFDLLQFVVRESLATKVIINARAGAVEDAVRVMKAGATDFIISENFDARISESILRALAHNSGTHSKGSESPSHADDAEPVLVGQSPAICEIRSAVNLVAKSQTTVLITGESGTGKEVVSRLIHLKSNRSALPFVALNCATLPKDVIENELFGHEKGAFTGALLKKQGCFELANHGTLFFDEIAEMSQETQAKLLRAIETQKFRRLGGKEEVKVDVRMIAATNKNLGLALKSKELREDLYYRLSVIEIFIPPLRERKEDIALLVEYFLRTFSRKYGKPYQRFNDECMEMLSAYDWPGNVREIRNVVERALVMSNDESIGSEYVPDKIQSHIASRVQINIPLGSSSYEAERILILQTLASAGNNKAKTAKILGLSRKTLHNKLVSFAQA
jgi:DNA-binding NtrC family response regulator